MQLCIHNPFFAIIYSLTILLCQANKLAVVLHCLPFGFQLVRISTELIGTTANECFGGQVSFRVQQLKPNRASAECPCKAVTRDEGQNAASVKRQLMGVGSAVHWSLL